MATVAEPINRSCHGLTPGLGAYPARRGGLRKYAAGVTPVSRRNAATKELADS
jgi:hypothetical protein